MMKLVDMYNSKLYILRDVRVRISLSVSNMKEFMSFYICSDCGEEVGAFHWCLPKPKNF